MQMTSSRRRVQQGLERRVLECLGASRKLHQVCVATAETTADGRAFIPAVKATGGHTCHRHGEPWTRPSFSAADLAHVFRAGDLHHRRRVAAEAWPANCLPCFPSSSAGEFVFFFGKRRSKLPRIMIARYAHPLTSHLFFPRIRIWLNQDIAQTLVSRNWGTLP